MFDEFGAKPSDRRDPGENWPIPTRIRSMIGVRVVRGGASGAPIQRAIGSPCDDRNQSGLVVRGGWDGHEPIETTESVMPFLGAQGYDIRVEEGTAVYADERVMSSVDVIVQVNTMNTIADEELAGLARAVDRGRRSRRLARRYRRLLSQGRGLPPAHRRAVRAPRGCAAGGAHRPAVRSLPGLHREYRRRRREHPIVAGIEDFDLHTEQYWVLSDAYNDVLATTQVVHRPFDAWNRSFTVAVMWTRLWGAGRIFVCTAGPKLDILNEPPVRTIVERGLLWASQ